MNPAGLGRCESKGLTEETQILRLGQCQLNIVTPAGSVSPLFVSAVLLILNFIFHSRESEAQEITPRLK